MEDVASSISSISSAVEEAVAGVTGVADSSQALASDMAGITSGMDTNQEIVGELQKQVDALSRQLRELDVRLQGLNWTIELKE